MFVYFGFFSSPTLGHIPFFNLHTFISIYFYQHIFPVQSHTYIHTHSLFPSHGTLDVVRVLLGTLVSTEVAPSRRRFPPTLRVSSSALNSTASLNEKYNFSSKTRLTSYGFTSSIFTHNNFLSLSLPPPSPTTTLLTSSSCHVTSLLALNIAWIESNGGRRTDTQVSLRGVPASPYFPIFFTHMEPRLRLEIISIRE